MFNCRQFYEDFDIEYYDGDYEHKHCRPGWIQIECPRCTGNPGLHLGFSEEKGIFVCWRCGFMPLIEAIKRLTGESWYKAKEIAKEYGGGKTYKRYTRDEKEKDIETKLPTGILKELSESHKNYLESRNFDPKHLTDTWDLKATGNKGNYKFRLIAPIYYRNILMSYQGRDITGKSSMKYKACPQENERRHHKHCLYGIDMVVGKSVLVVEGITDVWRMGIGSVATFGVKYTEAQVLLLEKYFDRIFVFFDEEDPEAQKQAQKLTMQLCALGKDAEHITLGMECDPADLSDMEARYVMRELLIR